jgi:DNA-binding transcriptional regulator GbsR (MarR family)
MSIENPEFGRNNPTEKEKVWKENLRDNYFENIIDYFRLKIPFNYFDLLENAIDFKKNFELLAKADKELLHNPNNQDLILKHQEAMDKISRLLIHESAIEISDENETWIIQAGNAITQK